ncbi:hypothetical protein ACVBEJ_14205 [Porticoccus sp. GXU_MW_L64]
MDEGDTKNVKANEEAKKPVVKIELLIGGGYTDRDGEDVTYGHVALRVYSEDGDFDYTYDFGRYHGEPWGIEDSEGEGTLRIWTNFDKYITGENATGRTTKGYVFSSSTEEAGKIISHFSSLVSGRKPNEERGDHMKQYQLATDYHAANCNCATVALDGLKAGNSELYRTLNQNKFDKGRGLSWLSRRAYRFAKSGDGVRMPLDLQDAIKQSGKVDSTNTYKW